MSTTIWDDPALAGARDNKESTDAERFDKVTTARPPKSGASSSAKRKKKSGKLYGTTMRVIRRVHLYCGLFMLPFVLLYGISAVYFNHPELLSTSTTEEFDADLLNGSGLSELPQPELLAARILESINLADPETSSARPPLVLVDPSTAEFSGSMSYSYQDEQQSYSVSINPVTREASLRTSERRTRNTEERATPNSFAEVPAQSALPEYAAHGKAAALAVLKAAGVGGEDLTAEALTPGRRGGTRFQFDAEADGTVYRVAYDLESGRGAAAPLGEAAEIEPERFLMRLHVSHGYPDELGVRWWWALVVDAMFVNMVMWGLSGALMWWQLKKTRKLGSVFLIASVVVTCWLFIGMHDELIANSRGRTVIPPATRTSPSANSPGQAGSESGRERSGQRGRRGRSGRGADQQRGSEQRKDAHDQAGESQQRATAEQQDVATSGQ